MKKRINSRAIIIEGDSIITMFRRKISDTGQVKEYYAIPGGGLEGDETLEENVIREIKEEFSIDIDILGYLGNDEDESGITHFFHCQRTSGIPEIAGPESDRNCQENYYEIRYLKLNELDDVEISYRDIINRAINLNYC